MPGIAPLPCAPLDPFPGRWPGGEAASVAAPPLTQRRSRTQEIKNVGGKGPASRGGGSSSRSIVLGRVRTPVGSRREPTGGGDGADAASDLGAFGGSPWGDPGRVFQGNP